MANVKLNVDISKTLDVRHIWSLVLRVEPGMEEWELVMSNTTIHRKCLITQDIVQHTCRCALSIYACTGGFLTLAGSLQVIV